MDLKEYQSLQRAKYAAFAQTVASILSTALSHDPSLRLQHVQHRGKDPESLQRKLAHRGIPYTTTLEAEIKDLAGCRLVFYTNSDVSRFLASGIVRDNFDIDWDRTKIHYPRPDVDQANGFFISHNYVVKLKEDRSVLPEYINFRDMWCEVQIRRPSTMLGRRWHMTQFIRNQCLMDSATNCFKVLALACRPSCEIF